MTVPLLKAAPEPDQLADRLDGGAWRGIELCLAPGHVADDETVERAIAVSREALTDGVAVTAEAPVAWPSGAFVRVDRLDAEAEECIRRSARFAAAVGSPVLTIHLFTPVDPGEYARGFEPDPGEIERFLRFYADACLEAGVKPLIENVPPVLRMRVGGVFLSPVGGHWRDLLAWRERVPELGFTVDTSHAALFRSFAAAYPSLFGLDSAEGLELERFVEELGPAAEVAHVSNARGLLGEGLPYGEGELDLDPIVRRLGELVPFIVAEINEPDHARSPGMKAGYREVERALVEAAGGEAAAPAPRRVPAPSFDWQATIERRDPVPALVELEERLGGKRVLVTGGGGSIGRALATFLGGFRPERIALLDTHEASLSADFRARDAEQMAHVSHVLCDVRDGARLEAEFARLRPDAVFHLAAYKHVDKAEEFPEEFVDTNLHGTWNVLQAAAAAGAQTVVVASTDKAASAASFYARTKRLMEEMTACVARREGAERTAVRLVNVLGSAGSASELFARQARAGVPLTVTDSGMTRYWITMAHAVALLAQAALLPAEGTRLATAAEPAMLTVGELAARIWRRAGQEGEPAMSLVGARPGETMSEILVGVGEKLAETPYQGVAGISGEATVEWAAQALDRLPIGMGREDARPIWLEAMNHQN